MPGRGTDDDTTVLHVRSVANKSTNSGSQTENNEAESDAPSDTEPSTSEG